MRESISPGDLRAERGARLIDIRKAPDDRRIPGSERHDGEALERDGLEENAPGELIVLYCGNGGSCARVAGTLRARGLNAVALEGGYRAWSEAGLPTEPR